MRASGHNRANSDGQQKKNNHGKAGQDWDRGPGAEPSPLETCRAALEAALAVPPSKEATHKQQALAEQLGQSDGTARAARVQAVGKLGLGAAPRHRVAPVPATSHSTKLEARWGKDFRDRLPAHELCFQRHSKTWILLVFTTLLSLTRGRRSC